MIFKTELKRDMKAGGVTYPTGTPVTCSHVKHYMLHITTPDGKNVRVSYNQAEKLANGFNGWPPSEKLLMQTMTTGMSVSPLGNECEVDGADEYGFPSIHRILLLV